MLSSEGNSVGSVLFIFLYLGPGNSTEAPRLLYKHRHPTEAILLWHKHVMETIEHTGFTLEKSGCEAGKGKMS